jgi:hypothetical protein
MPRKRHTPELIIRKLREAEVELAEGQMQIVGTLWGIRSNEPHRDASARAPKSATSLHQRGTPNPRIVLLTRGSRVRVPDGPPMNDLLRRVPLPGHLLCP